MSVVVAGAGAPPWPSGAPINRYALAPDARVIHAVAVTRHRRLRLMWDWFAFPVWDIDAGENITSLPIGHQLRDDLQRWSDEWSELHWPPDVDDQPLATSAQEASHYQRASQLADRLRQELGGGYEVVVDV